MKKILLILSLLPIFTVGQTSRWRTNPPSQQTPQQPQQPQRPQTPTTPQRPQNPPNTSSWRNNPPAPSRYNPPQSRYNNRQYNNRYYGGGSLYHPYGYNRWDRWGAPTYGYRYYTNGYYFNRWGYRQPYRVYVYENNTVDTIRGHQPHLSVGVQFATSGGVGGWFTFGDRVYFIMDMTVPSIIDRSTYFPYGTLNLVDFPLTNDLRRLNTFYFGLGKKIGRTGVHVMVGAVNENVRYRGYDSYGYITFPKYVTNYMSVKVGVIHDYKNFSFKADYDPKLADLTIGAGINF